MPMLTVGIIAEKNTLEEIQWISSYLEHAVCEPYSRSSLYDLVIFLNVTKEILYIKKHTQAKVIVVCMEPMFIYPPNYDSNLLNLADRYIGYQNFAGSGYQGLFEPFVFPVYAKEQIINDFPVSLASERTHDFCIFATHDPNIRRHLGTSAGSHNSILAGPLFNNRVLDKRSIQRACRYELITENDINDYYMSEKLGAALVAGCVPVYWGCRSVGKHVPSGMIVDMQDFLGPEGVPDVDRVIAHCMKPGVYESHYRRIKDYAYDWLIEHLSLETCLIDPLQRFIDDINLSGWRAKKVPLISRIARLVLDSVVR